MSQEIAYMLDRLMLWRLQSWPKLRRAERESHCSRTQRVSRSNHPTARQRTCLIRMSNSQEDGRPHSRGMICPGLAKPSPSKPERAQGKPGAQCTRSLVCTKKSTRVSHHGSAETRRHSLRNGLRLMLVL